MATNDPIQGLIDYVNEIKPFHTKILEVAVAYAQNDDVDITITEEFNIDVSLFWPALADEDDVPIRDCPEGWGEEWDRQSAYIVIDASISPQTVTLNGDQSAFFAEGTRFEIREPDTELGSPLPTTTAVTLENYVAVNATGFANDNRIFSSQDGITWTRRVEAIDTQHSSITYSPTLQRFVVVHRTRDISYSDDAGVTWTLESNAFPVSGGAGPNYLWEYVDWIDDLGMFIAGNDSTDVDEEKIAYSTDGLTWTLADTISQWPTRPQAPITSDFVWVETLGVVVAGAYSSNNDPHAGNIVWSYDGITWTYVQDAIGATEPFAVNAAQKQALVWSDTLDKLYAVAGTGSNSTLIRVYEYDTSAAGSPLFVNGTWTPRVTTPPWGANGIFDTAIYAGGSIQKLIFVGEGSDATGGSPDSDKYNLITSSDGVNWKGHMLGSRTTGGGGTRLYGATYSAALDRVTVFSNNTGGTGSPIVAPIAWYSDDGNTWTSTTFPVITSPLNFAFQSAAVGEGSVTTKIPDQTPRVYEMLTLSSDYDETTNKTVLGALETGFDYQGSPILFGSPLTIGSPQFPLPGSPPFDGNEFFFPPYPDGSISNGDVFIIHDVTETTKLNIVTRPSPYYGSPPAGPGYSGGSPFKVGSPLPGSPKRVVGSPATLPSGTYVAGNTITFKGITTEPFNYGREVSIRNASEPTINRTYNILNAVDLGGSPELIQITVLDMVHADTTNDGELVFTPDGYSGGSYCSDVPPEFGQTHWMEDLQQTWRFEESPLEENFQLFILEANSTDNTYVVEGDVRYLLTLETTSGSPVGLRFGTGSPVVVSVSVQHAVSPPYIPFGSPVGLTVTLSANNGNATVQSISYDSATNRSTLQLDAVTANTPTGWITFNRTAEAILGTSAEHYWAFDGAGSPIAKDTGTGPRYDFNGVSGTVGYGQPSLRADGTGSSIKINDSDQISDTIPITYDQNFTIECIIQPENIYSRAVGGGTSLTTINIHTFSNTGSDGTWTLRFDNYGSPISPSAVTPEFSLQLPGNGNSITGHLSNTVAEARGTTSITAIGSPAPIYHLLGTVDFSAGQIDLYVNGVLEDSVTGLNGSPSILTNWLQVGNISSDLTSPTRNFRKAVTIGAQNIGGSVRFGQIGSVDEMIFHEGVFMDAAQAAAQAAVANFTP